MKRTPVIERIIQTMHSIEPDAETILFGSEARGDAMPNSDIDLLVLLDAQKVNPERETRITQHLYELELDTGIIISPLIMTRRQWEERPFDTPFTINVMNDGVRI